MGFLSPFQNNSQIQLTDVWAMLLLSYKCFWKHSWDIIAENVQVPGDLACVTELRGQRKTEGSETKLALFMALPRLGPPDRSVAGTSDEYL